MGGATVLTDLEVDGTTLVVDEVNNRVGVGDGAPGTTLQVKERPRMLRFRIQHLKILTVVVSQS